MFSVRIKPALESLQKMLCEAQRLVEHHCSLLNNPTNSTFAWRSGVMSQQSVYEKPVVTSSTSNDVSHIHPTLITDAYVCCHSYPPETRQFIFVLCGGHALLFCISTSVQRWNFCIKVAGAQRLSSSCSVSLKTDVVRSDEQGRVVVSWS